jgi:hypothetical protein
MNTPSEKKREGLAAALDAVRKELLDLGLRNPLLNYRPLKSRGVEFSGARGADIYEALVGGGEHFSFCSLEDRQDRRGGQIETVLNTSLTAKQLESRLLATYYAARTSLEEQGVNTLFLAIGMLHWLEDDSSEEVHRAPLILVPVELERASARERFRMKYNGDEIGTNVSLAELVKQSFSIRLLEMPEIEDLDVADYLEAVAEEVSGQRAWSVDRESVVLGFFSFSKFLMYRDLDPSTKIAARPGFVEQSAGNWQPRRKRFRVQRGGFRRRSSGENKPATSGRCGQLPDNRSARCRRRAQYGDPGSPWHREVADNCERDRGSPGFG